MKSKAFFKEWGSRVASSYLHSPGGEERYVEPITWNEVFEAFEAKLVERWWRPHEALHNAELVCRYFSEEGGGICNRPSEVVKEYLKRHERKYHGIPDEPECDHTVCFGVIMQNRVPTLITKSDWEKDPNRYHHITSFRCCPKCGDKLG